MLLESQFSAFFISPEQAILRKWDVVIIGSGMGGSAAAYKLAENGKKVLVLEKGLLTFGQSDSIVEEETDPEKRLQSGKWPTQLTAYVDGKQSNVWAPLGCGVGGSTLLYAAALQRLRRSDFSPQRLPDGTTIEWPFSYKEIEPYYIEAEALFSVCGTVDPGESDAEYNLLQPPKMSETDQHFFQEFESVNLRPYQLHTGIKYQNQCTECSGHICQRACKQDAGTACIQPALKTGNLFVVEQAEVLKLETDGTRVKEIIFSNNSQTFSLSPDKVILSAGAYFSPVILQKSQSNQWPKGLANGSDMVGRNLMFHASDFIAVWPNKKCSRDGPRKTLAFRDFYELEGNKLGEFQSTGSTAGYGNVVYALRLMFDQSLFRKFSFFRHFLRIPAYIAAKLFGEATIFATIVEDFPYPENRILADESAKSGMRFEYHVHSEFRERILMFRRAVCKHLSNLKTLPMAPGISLNYGHPCGTCVAGRDPSNSVLDANCKAHELENLYVVDASFMPTSGGTNPSLTVAANALRVADKIVAGA